jgi:hypothetical protein
MFSSHKNVIHCVLPSWHLSTSLSEASVEFVFSRKRSRALFVVSDGEVEGTWKFLRDEET